MYHVRADAAQSVMVAVAKVDVFCSPGARDLAFLVDVFRENFARTLVL